MSTTQTDTLPVMVSEFLGLYHLVHTLPGWEVRFGDIKMGIEIVSISLQKISDPQTNVVVVKRIGSETYEVSYYTRNKKFISVIAMNDLLLYKLRKLGWAPDWLLDRDYSEISRLEFTMTGTDVKSTIDNVLTRVKQVEDLVFKMYDLYQEIILLTGKV